MYERMALPLLSRFGTSLFGFESLISGVGSDEDAGCRDFVKMRILSGAALPKTGKRCAFL